MKITLIRHSKTNPTKDIPIPLWGNTNDGFELCERLCENQVIKNIDVIYYSLETKALETAVLLAKENSIPIKTDKNFEEISSFTQKFYVGDEFEKNIQKYYGKKVARIGDGESIEEALYRFNDAIERTIAKEGDAENIGIVSHGGILSLFSE